MISDNVFSDWLTSLVTFFDKNVIFTSRDVTRGEYNIYSPRVTSSTKLNQRNRSDKSLFSGRKKHIKCGI